MVAKARMAMILISLLTFPLIAVFASAEVVVDIEEPFKLEVEDLGLEGMAAGGSDEQKILVVGADGFARILDGDDPKEQIELTVPEYASENTLRAVSWHPRGNTALIGGDNGTLLRYAQEDHSVTTVDAAGQLGGQDVHAVSWNTAGSHAYIGDEDGWLWAYREGEGGVAIFDLLVEESGSMITGIDCHPEVNLCLVTTVSDGIAIIDSRTNHTVHWIGQSGKVWRGVSCADPLEDKCITISSGLSFGIIGLNIDEPEKSNVMLKMVADSSGVFTHIHERSSGESLICMTPFEVIAWDHDEDEAYDWVDYSDAQNMSVTLAGERLIGSWATVENDNVGFLVTSEGSIVPFHPSVDENVLLDSIVSYIVAAMVIVAVPGVLFGLIFMNSTRLQSWYYSRRQAKREAKEEAQKRAAKEAKKKKRDAKKR
ncbi:MAG: hypothetical protein VX320_00655 [Candidatus Thermoplasmatota archaeon]|nr:hypothetical protein [Candidatus Thermoplasmatota archaeon]